VERGELRLHYQPIVDLLTGHCVGVEALCRWQHPIRGLVMPATFIPLAEENGFIRQIGLWTLQEALSVIGGPSGAGMPIMSVNLSMRNLRGTDLAANLAEMIERAGVPATLEATAASQGVWTKDVAFGTIDIGAAVQRASGGAPPTVSQPVVTAKPKPQKAKARAATKKAKRARP